MNENVEEMYNQLVGQFRRYIGHVTANVGGVYENIKTSAKAEPVYEVTPRAKQKEAMIFLQTQVFQTPKWLMAKDIWNRINNPGEADPIATLQEGALTNLISTSRLNRMQESAERYGADKAYNAIELLNDVQNILFSELVSRKPIESHRRRLQKSYVDKLNNILNGGSSMGMMMVSLNPAGAASFSDVSKSDIPSIARTQLVDLRSEVARAAPLTTDKMSKIHLLDLQQRIKNALDPKK
jgi:hypothetical protein